MNINNALRLLVGCVMTVVVTGFVHHNEVTGQQIEMLKTKLAVVDEDGNPVEEAVVYCTGLRTKVSPGSHWGWSEKIHGPLPKLKTNAKGIVMMPYPKYVEEKLDTGQVTWTVEHPNFVPFREDRSVEDPNEIQLMRGFRIAATAINGTTGKKIKENLFGLMGGSRDDWDLKKNGMLVSPVFKKGESVLRLCQVEEGKPVLFSEVIEVDPEDRSRVLLKDVKLFAGVRVEGEIDQSVPRPIKNGYVNAMIVRSTPSRPSYEGQLVWGDKTPIAEDGTFVFESLPGGKEVVQLIPVCDDWVPGQPQKAMVRKHFPKEARNLDGAWGGIPQVFEIGDETIMPVLKMKKATSARIRVQDPEGNPLPDATVFMGPNQYWFSLGSQILGEGGATSQALVKSRSGDFKWNRVHRYQAKTDLEGIALIRHLPVKESEAVYVELDGFEMPISSEDGRSGRAQLKAGEVVETIVTLQPKGTDVLDGGSDDPDVEKDQADEGNDDKHEGGDV